MALDDSSALCKLKKKKEKEQKKTEAGGRSALSESDGIRRRSLKTQLKGLEWFVRGTCGEANASLLCGGEDDGHLET